jgi:phosphoglycerol transferase MdoB-like AlkP superfamily enzyme
MVYEYSSSFRPVKIRVFFVAFVYIVAANIPLWIASRSMGLLLIGVFNVEFLIIGILSVFLRRRLTVGLLLGAVFLDIVRGIGSTYMFSPSEMLRSVRYLFESSSSHSWHVTVIAICSLVACLLAVFASSGSADARERRYVVRTLLVFFLLCGGVDVLMGHLWILRRDIQSNVPRMTRFPTHFLVTSEWQAETFRNSSRPGINASVKSATTRLVASDTTVAPLRTSATLPNVVLILVESWGKARVADLEAALVRPYADEGLFHKYTVRQGTVPFHGATINGEARELCGSAMGFGLLSASASQLKGCLPARMNGMGYHTMAVHGFNSRMFDRGEWYRTIGFAETWFQEGLQRSGLPVCPGAFPGICDAAASMWIGDQLQRSDGSPEFIYWVTLNSHLPVPIPNLVMSPPSCTSSPIAAESPALCSWYQLEFNVHRSIAELAMRQTTRPTVFLVVGDHAPPFSSAKLRSQFSDEVVPYVLLEPKPDGIKETLQKVRSFAVATRSPAGMHRSHFRKISLSGASGGQ